MTAIPEAPTAHESTMQEQDTPIRQAMRVATAATAAALVLALFPLTPDPAGDIKYLILAWAAAILSGMALYGAWLGRCRLGRPSLLTGFILAFLAVNGAATLTSPHGANSLHELARLATLVALYFAVAQAYDAPSQVWRLLTVIAAAVALASLYGFCQRLGFDPFPWSTRNVEEYRGMPATFGNPNIASHVLNLAFLMALGLALRKRIWWCGVFALLIGAHLLLAGVRAAFVAVPAALVFVHLPFLMRSRAKRPARAILASCIIFIILGTATVAAAMGATKAQTGSYFPLDRSLLLRYHSFYGASEMIQARPVLGFGPGSYSIENPPYWTGYERERFALKRMPNKNVHNDYLEAAVDAGVLATAAYLGLLLCAAAYSLAMAFRSSDTDRRGLGLVLAACCCALAVDSAFGFPLHAPASAALLFILAGLAEGLRAGTPPTERPRLLMPAVLVVGVALAAAGLEASAFAGQMFLQRAHGAEIRGYADAARNFLTAGERCAPWDFQFASNRGGLELEQGRLDEAASDLETALALSPYDVISRAALMEVYWAQADQAPNAETESWLEKAAAQAGRVLELCPALPEGHTCLARINAVRAERAAAGSPEAADRWNDARRHANGALLYSDVPREVLERIVAEASEALGELDEAERAYRRAGGFGPASDATWRRFYAFAAAQGRWNAMAIALNNALRIEEAKSPVNPETVATLSVWLAKVNHQGLGQTSLARDTVLHAMTLAPARMDLWGAYAETFDPAEQPEALRKALGSKEDKGLQPHVLGEEPRVPSDEEVAARAAIEAVLDSDDTRLAEAATALQSACHLRSRAVDGPALAREYGWLAERLAGRLDAPALSDEARGEGLQTLGIVYLMMADWQRAADTLEKAMKYLPSSRRIYGMLQRAEALSQLGRPFDAERLVKEAIAQAPALFQARYLLARIHAKAGWRTQARQEYEALLQNPMLDEDTRRNIADELETLHRAADAASSKDVPK